MGSNKGFRGIIHFDHETIQMYLQPAYIEQLVFSNEKVPFMGQFWVINASSNHWSMVLNIHQSPLGYVTNIVSKYIVACQRGVLQGHAPVPTVWVGNKLTLLL